MAKIVIPAALLLALIVVLIVLIRTLKRMAMRAEAAAAPTWTLHELARLRDTGELTIEEFERLKARAVGELKRPGGAANVPVKPPSNSAKTESNETKPE